MARTCDAMSLVSASLREDIIKDGGSFRDVAAHRHAVPRYSGTDDRGEHIKVTLRGLQSGNFRLKLAISGGGSIFTVGVAVNERCGTADTYQGLHLHHRSPAISRHLRACWILKLALLPLSTFPSGMQYRILIV